LDPLAHTLGEAAATSITAATGRHGRRLPIPAIGEGEKADGGRKAGMSNHFASPDDALRQADPARKLQDFLRGLFNSAEERPPTREDGAPRNDTVRVTGIL